MLRLVGGCQPQEHDNILSSLAYLRDCHQADPLTAPGALAHLKYLAALAIEPQGLMQMPMLTKVSCSAMHVPWS